MNERISLCLPSIGPSEEESVLQALRSGWVAPAGPQLDGFESALAALTTRPAVVAVSSGTAALHLALIAAGIGAGDEVAVSTLTFAATTNALAYVGASPVFIDCDEFGLMSVELLGSALKDRAESGRPIAAVLPVDIYGRVADYPAIAEVAARFEAIVVSDAAESLGAALGGHAAGSFGEFAAMSFNGNKIVTTSSGGAVLCPDGLSARRVRYLAAQARQPVPHYEHTEIGFNYRLSNILAAVGLAQLRRLPQILERKRAHHLAYRAMVDRLDGVGLLEPGEGNCWMNVLVLDPESDHTAGELGAALDLLDIETRPVFKPMHLQPVHAGCDLSFVSGRAESLYRRGLVLPSSTDLTEAERSRVITAVSRILRSRRAA